MLLVVGAASSGRSTLVRCRTGVYRPDAGEVTFRLGGRALKLTAAIPHGGVECEVIAIASFDGQLAAAPRLPAAIVVARVHSERSAAVAALASSSRGPGHQHPSAGEDGRSVYVAIVPRACRAPVRCAGRTRKVRGPGQPG